jgi:hypothetical protein
MEKPAALPEEMCQARQPHGQNAVARFGGAHRTEQVPRLAPWDSPAPKTRPADRTAKATSTVTDHPVSEHQSAVSTRKAAPEPDSSRSHVSVGLPLTAPAMQNL